MANQHNPNIPDLSNQISADIVDIKENLEFHKDAFQRILQAWSDTDNSAQAMGTIGFNDDTYAITFPTNGMAAAKFMLGNSNTIAWFYLNAAPPGWKTLATGADTVLGVSGGAGDYNVNGGNPDSSATWNFAHTHQWLDSSAGDGNISDLSGNFRSWDSDGATPVNVANFGDAYTILSTLDTWRPSASVGKLFQLDTA